MFGNVRACTLMHFVLRDDRRWRCPWLLLGFTIFGETAVPFGGLAAVRNRRTRPDWKYLLGSKRRLWSAVLKTPNEVADVSLFSRDSFCGLVLRSGRRMKPQIVRFQGQICLFTCPVFGLYKYIFISSSNTSLLILRTLERYLERLERKSLKITSLILSTHIHMHQSSSKHHLGFSSIC